MLRSRAQQELHARSSAHAHFWVWKPCNSVASQTTNVPDSETKFIKKISCIFCKEAHKLDLCEKFLKIPLVRKREIIVTNWLCWGCLRWGHINSKCCRKRVCRTCNGLHPTALHGDKREEKVKVSPSTPKVAESEEDKSNQERTIPIELKSTERVYVPDPFVIHW